ncbi:MAG: hypothetical protein HQK58_17110 [Deltaproteobacteria bacterium]|nr:hypothetical protein [Deltaproteobacteria bacterium]
MHHTDHDKLDVIFPHWIHHNQEHAEAYRTWQEKLTSMGYTEAAAKLGEAQDLVSRLNEIINEAQKLIHK